MVAHRGLIGGGRRLGARYELRRRSLRHLQAAGFAFDVFTGDWVRALTTGGTLVACPREPARPGGVGRSDPARADRVPRAGPGPGRGAGRRARAAGATCPPSACWPSARTPSARALRRLRRLLGRGRVVNSYGLTEATSTAALRADRWRTPTETAPSRSAGRSPGRGYVLDGRHRSRRAWRASCTSAAAVWRAATSSDPRGRPSGSSPTRSATPERGSTHGRPCAVAWRTARSSCWAGSTARSRSAAFGSSWARSRRRSAAARGPRGRRRRPEDEADGAPGGLRRRRCRPRPLGRAVRLLRDRLPRPMIPSRSSSRRCRGPPPARSIARLPLAPDGLAADEKLVALATRSRTLAGSGKTCSSSGRSA